MENDDYFESGNSSSIKCILGLVTFSTILPIKSYTSIEDMTRFTWFWPFIHLLIGLVASGFAFLLMNYLNFSNFFISTIIYGFLLLISGYNHLDGLMDMADGVMAFGDYKTKIDIMKDHMVGAGGISTFFIVGTITIGAIFNLLNYNLIFAIAIAEMSSKISLMTTCLSSKAKEGGMGSFFVKSVNKINYTITLIITLIISFIISSYVGLFGIIGAMFSGAIISLIAKRNFEIANGDVLGASNEIGRMFSLIAMNIFILI